MMEFFQQLPHLEPYGNPQYFVYVIAATLPIFIGLFFKKRFAWYEVLVSLFFIVTMLVGGKTNQLAALGIYLCWEILLLLFYKHYRKSKDGKWVFYLVSFLSLLPIIFVKVQPAINGTQSLLGFLGISYLTFRSVGIIIELRDGVIKDFTLWEFLRFLLFMPTFSSGPIDRFKRFNENYQAIPERDELMDMLDESVRYIMRGFLYKFILAHVLGETLLPPLKNLALQSGGFFNLYALAVMYTFGLELFFDFAGYSMFALAISNLMGIRSPINFNKPFLSRDLSEVIEIIDELFMEDVSDMMDEDLFDAGVLDSMGTVELIVEIENRFDIRVPVTEFGRDDWNTANKIIAGIVELQNA